MYNYAKSLIFVSVLFFCFAPIFKSSLFGQGTVDTTFVITNPMEVYPTKFVLKEVIVEGSAELSPDFIPTTAGLAIGEEITIPGDDISNAIERLYQTGLFSDVKIFKGAIDGRMITLRIVLQEKPRVNKFVIEGIKRSQRKDIEELITLLRGTAITDNKIGQIEKTILRYYRRKGFIGSSVATTFEIVDEENNRADLFFKVDAGYMPRLRDIEFYNNEGFTDRTLKKNFKPIKEDTWFRLGKKVLKEEELAEAKESLIGFYQKNGYKDIRIVADSVTTFKYKKGLFRKNRTGTRLHVSLEEGPQYKIRNLYWEGNTVYTDEQLSLSLGFAKGDVFDQAKFDQNLNINAENSDITSLYQNIGYLFFQIRESFEVVGEDSLDIYFQMAEDEKANINVVDFIGNTATFDDVVRRTLRTIPGQTYSRSDVMRTIRELGTIGYFNAESITPDLKPDFEDKTVDITFNLEESQSINNFEFSGGYGGAQIGLILSARLNFNNFSLQNAFKKEGWKSGLPMGDGQSLSLGVQVTGQGFQSYSFGFQEPWFRGKPTSVGFNASYNFIDFQNSNNRFESLNVGISVGKRLTWPDDFFTLRSRVNFSIQDATNQNLDGRFNYISYTQELERNSLDNLVSPTNGSRFNVSAQIAPPVFGRTQFFKIKTNYQNHINIFDKFVFTYGFEGGYMGFLGVRNRLQGVERFSMGGTPLQQRQQFFEDNITLRGFPGGNDGTIQPYENNIPVGGRVFNKYFVEFRYPAVSSEQINLIPYSFIDSGNVYKDFQSFDPFNIKRAAGFGVRVFMPILGLVDLSYGYRFDGVEGSRTVQPGQWEFLFNLGAPF
jgi:outer membrane protein insertion porin family